MPFLSKDPLSQKKLDHPFAQEKRHSYTLVREFGNTTFYSIFYGTISDLQFVIKGKEINMPKTTIQKLCETGQ